MIKNILRNVSCSAVSFLPKYGNRSFLWSYNPNSHPSDKICFHFFWLSAHFCVCLPKSPFSACCASVVSIVVSSVLSIALFAPTMLSTYRTMHTRAWTSLPYAICPYVLPPECSPVASCFRYICHTDPFHTTVPLSILHVLGNLGRVPMSPPELRTCNICPVSVSPIAVALRYVFSTIGRGPASVVHSETKTTDPSCCPSSLFSVICILGPGFRP